MNTRPYARKAQPASHDHHRGMYSPGWAPFGSTIRDLLAAKPAAHYARIDDGRLLAVEPTRLFIDAHSPAEWREKQFYPVLNERVQTKEANLYGGLMAKMLLLKRQHPLPTVSPLPGGLIFSLESAPSCPTIEEFDAFANTNSLWAMPCGLPDLSDREYSALRTWLEEDAAYAAPPPLGGDPGQHFKVGNIFKWE